MMVRQPPSPRKSWTALGLALIAAPLAAAQTRVPDSIATLEQGIVAETNLLRRDPQAYAKLLEELLPRFEGSILSRPGALPLQTREGKSAVEEAIQALRRASPMDTLVSSKDMALAARDHVRDQGPRGDRGHDGSDGSTFADRVSRYGVWDGGLGENIYYGEGSAREVVAQLLIDDGISSRSHRKTLLNPTFRMVGVACGSHARNRQMCVMEYAVLFAPGATADGPVRTQTPP